MHCDSTFFILTIRTFTIFKNKTKPAANGWGFRPDLFEDFRDLEIGRMVDRCNLSEFEGVVRGLKMQRERSARKAWSETLSHSRQSQAGGSLNQTPPLSISISMSSLSLYLAEHEQSSTNSVHMTKTDRKDKEVMAAKRAICHKKEKSTASCSV